MTPASHPPSCPPGIEQAALKNIPETVAECWNPWGLAEDNACRKRVAAYTLKVERLPAGCARSEYQHWVGFYKSQITEAFQRDHQQIDADNLAKHMVRP